MTLFVLADFSVIKPDFGLLFWTTVIFLLFWFLIGKLAFKPITEALKKRETDIQDALDEAKKARQEISNLEAKHEKLLDQAKEERSQILMDAKEAAEVYKKEQKAKADDEFRVKVDSALQEIENRKMEAMVSIKNDAGQIALDIAEKILKKELKGDPAQESFVKGLVDEIKLS